MNSYGVQKLEDYKQLVPGFFKFYSQFNYSQVISPFEGRAENATTYKMRYRRFFVFFNGINVAGPVNQGKNCGIFDYACKNKFIEICNATSNCLAISEDELKMIPAMAVSAKQEADEDEDSLKRLKHDNLNLPIYF